MKNKIQIMFVRGLQKALNHDNGPRLPRHWKVIASTILLLLTLGIGQMWGDVTYDLTGYSTQIANGWTHDYGNIYVGRKGSNYTPSDGGLPTGNGSIFAAFQVTESSSIRVVFVWTKTNGDLSGKQIDLASINKATYDKLALASTGTGNDVKYSIDNFSSSQHSAVAINRSDANKDINIDFETTVSAGYYAVYTASSINANALIKKIIVTPASATPSCTSNPADPTGLSAGSITADGATFTITDGANTNNYEIVCKTTSGTPAANATPTKTGTAKTLAVTGLDAATTYYAWVRSVCDATHKSEWVALGAGTFTTKSCSISSCGNASLTYVIKVGSSGSQETDGSDFIVSATPSNATALGASTTVGLSTIGITDGGMKQSANPGACFDSKQNMTGKIGVYNGSSYSSSNYLQFAFTVKSGYTFTPCDIRFVVQPVDAATSFRWEVRDGTTVYGYGIETDVPTGSNGGASVLLGLTSTVEMAAGDYYIRLYPYTNAASKTFRLGTDVVLRGTTAAAEPPSCSAPTSPEISGETAYTEGGNISLTASATGAGSATFTWYKGVDWATASAGSSIGSGATLAINSCSTSDAGTYWCNISNGTGCEVQVSQAITVAEASATKYNVNIGLMTNGSVSADLTEAAENATVTLTVTPSTGYRLASLSVTGDESSSAVTVTNNEFTMPAEAVTVNATFELIPTYTVTLNPNNGTIESYDGWTLNAGKYTKTVAEGTELALLEFTRSGYEFMTWRAGGVDKTSPITVSADIELKAIWGTEEVVTIYSWESPSGTAIEEGGTATHYNGNDVYSGDKNRVNYPQGGYYTLSLNNSVDYSTDHIRIALDEALKEGDKIEMTGYCDKDGTKSVGPKVSNSSNVVICSADNVPDIHEGANGGVPTTQTKTLNSSAEGETTIKLTRSSGATTVFITKLVITRTEVVEEMDPAATPTITTQPTGGTYAWNADATQTVVATVSDGGTLSYQWYKKGDSDTKVGTNSASYTPTVSGTYYVIVTNTKTGYAKTTKKSNEVSVTINERPSYKVTYYDGAVKLGEETVLEDAKPTHAGDYDELPMAEFQGWFNDADLAPEHAVASVGDEVITAATNYYSKWNKTYASSVDFVQFIADNTTSGDYATYLSTNGYLLIQGTGHENALDNSNAFDTGLKLKTSTDTKLQFNVAAGKIIKLTVGKINGMSIAINGAAATAIASGTDATHLGVSYYYSANTQAVTIAETATKYNIIKVIEFLDPMTVTYDATTNGGSCATENATFTGTALTLPEATKSGWQFDGWFTTANDDTETGELVGEAGDTYTPSANITLYARFTETTTLATLTDIKVNGTTVAGFEVEKFEYNIVLPYKTSDVPTVAYTKGYSGATVTMTPSTITSVFGDVTLHVVSQDESKSNDYVLHITEAPKDMLCLIQATHTDATTATVTGYIGGTPDKNTQGNSKLGSKGHYFGIQLTSGTFQAGDVVLLRTADGADTNGDKVRIFKSNVASEENVLVEGTEAMIYGDNYVTLPETNLNQLYLRRGTNDEAYNTGWNPWIAVFAVYRPFPTPILSAITIDGASGSISGTAVSVTIPAVSNVASLSVVPTFMSNDPANTSGEVTSNAGAWVLGDNTYVVTDKDGDATTYTITLNQAAAIKEVQISGTLSVQEGSTTTLTATVIDTYDAPAAIQDVTWTSDATSVATVDNGVVTGKTVGTAHITATSVADGTKYATVEVTVTENLCREWNTPDNISDATISVGKVRMTHPSCSSNSVRPYSDASNVNMLKIEAQKGSTSKYFDIYFSDGALFESLELGLATGSSSALNYAIAFCSASTFDEEKIISVEEYPANPNNVAQALNNIVLPDGTKSVRLYKSFQVDQETTKGSGSSIYIYHVAACKKEIVAVSGVTLNKSALSLPRRSSETLVATVAPNNATDKSLTWESDDETVATVDANGLVKAVGEGTANITATSVADGTKSATCAVTVTAFDCAGFTGDLFTLEVTTTSSQTYNIGNGTEVELLAAHVDVDGGHAYAGRDGSTKGDVSGYIYASSNVACIRLQKANSMQGYLKVVLDDCTLRNSDVISFTQRASEERSISITRTAEFSNAIKTGDEYTVTQGDGLAGTNTFYVWYDGSQRVDVKTLTVTRVALVDITSVSLADMTVRTTKSRAPQLTTDPADGTILSVEYEIIGSTPASTIDPNTGVVTAGDVEEVFTVQVTVNGDKVATCEVTVVANLTQLDVEESTLWDFSKAGVTTNFTDEVLANVDGVTLDASQFNARQLVGSANNIASTYFQGTMLSFNATEPGLLSVRFTSGNNNARVLKVYDEAENVLAEWSYSGAATENESVEVPAGKVTLRSFQGEAANNVRIMRMEFRALEERRAESWIVPGELGTVCLKNDAKVVGANLYELQGHDENGYMAFDQILSGELEAGKPYLFEATAVGQISFYTAVGANHTDEAGSQKGMYGTFENKVFNSSNPEDLDVYYFSGRHIWAVKNYTVDIPVNAYRCYVKMDEFKTYPADASPAPGRRRVTLGVNGNNAPTDVENVQSDEVQCTKVMINGQLFILRGEKMFDVTGKLVK